MFTPSNLTIVHAADETAGGASRGGVAILEDHGAMRVLLRDILTRTGWTVAGTAGTVEAGLKLVRDTAPDIVIVDLYLASEGGGHAFIGEMAASHAGTKLLVFTASSDPEELRAVASAGVAGIVLKEGGLPELLGALEAVQRGERFYSPSLSPEARERLQI